jgi:hypothetical protein
MKKIVHYDRSPARRPLRKILAAILIFRASDAR